ncbi:hypothetical protein WMY93_022982 [Mugilogobius chulae]|uniref:Fibronectin type-III domain-containing protein n=1 Tax=Mugilogobius chulae TaxID=88201 RepID=A0AAW0N9V2_9GOBI
MNRERGEQKRPSSCPTVLSPDSFCSQQLNLPPVVVLDTPPSLVNSHKLTFHTVDPRRKYHVKILAVGQAGEGYQTDQTVTTPGCLSTRDQLAATPPAPNNMIVLANNSTSVSLRWSRPAFTSGKVVSYTVRCTPVGTHNASAIRYLQTTKQSSMEFGCLPPNFAISAQSPACNSRVTLIEDDTALVSWREPPEPNIVVTHYTIMYASQKSWLAGNWQIIQREGSHTMALLERLEPGSIYLVKISASNQVGDGPFSNPVELALKRGSAHRSKNPRHSDSFPDTTVLSDGRYHIDQNSMTGIIVGVSIALACIIMCALILISKGRPRKTSGHKVIAVGNPDVLRPGVPHLNERHGENVEALIPMMREHFIDAQGGSAIVMNSSGPVNNMNQTKRWLLFSQERNSTTENDAESRASLYEAGKTVLTYEDRLGAAPLPPSSREIIYGPLHSESSHSSEGSQETGDSGHYSNEVSNEEMSNPSTSQSSRPASFGQKMTFILSPN